MKRELTGNHAVAFTCENDLGEVTSRIDTPSRITSEIDRGLSRGQSSGLVYGNGLRWEWWSCDDETDILIEITRNGEVEDTIPVPLSGWLAFQLVAARRGVEPKAWLATVLGVAMSDDITLREALQWLFPRKSEEAQRFEQAQREFHQEAVVA